MPEIREMRASEYAFLREMLYEAIFVPPDGSPLPKGVTGEPHLSRYVADFGRPGDAAFVLLDGEELVGAVWSRRFSASVPGYGFVDEATPELSIAIKPRFRGKGFGTRMIETILRRLASDGVEKVSLSVDRRSRAGNLYVRMGFRVTGSDGPSARMVKHLDPDDRV